MPTNIYDMTDTWSNGGTTFDAIKMNVTNSASAAGSTLLNLQVGGSAKFTVLPSLGVRVGAATGGGMGDGTVNATGLYINGVSVTTLTSGFAPLASPVFTGDPQAPTPATADNDTSIATTAFVKAQGYATTSALAGYQPLDGDLTALAATSGTNTIYYRSAADTWTAVTMGGNMTFSGGVLNSTGGGGGAPVGAQYIVGATDATLSAERVGTNSTSITWDFGTAGQALVKRAA